MKKMSNKKIRFKSVPEGLLALKLGSDLANMYAIMAVIFLIFTCVFPFLGNTPLMWVSWVLFVVSLLAVEILSDWVELASDDIFALILLKASEEMARQELEGAS